MLYGFVLVIHVMVCLVLMAVILLQGGRGGLSETLAAGGTAQSLFGGGVTTVLTRITGVCAVVFMVTCLTLAYLSTVGGRSVIDQLPAGVSDALPGLPGVIPSSTVPPVSPASTTSVPAAPASPTPSSEAPPSSR